MNMQLKSQRLRWNTINWKEVHLKVFKWQQKIYQASKINDIKKVRSLQDTLLNSYHAKLLAIRKITQDNKCEVISGIDGFNRTLVLAPFFNIRARLTPDQRMTLVSELKFPTQKNSSAATIKDNCLQALMKLALEPEWEAKFEPNSYGFRPGRTAHDAIKTINTALSKNSKYVLDADLTKCFKKINHESLIKKIGLKGKYARQIKYWLESGILDETTFEEVETLQGGVISSLLVNIAFHGLEFEIKEWIKSVKIKNRTGGNISPAHRPSTIQIIRFANKLVILHSDRGVILKCKEIIYNFLTNMGLDIAELEKIRITNSLKLNSNDTSDLGFDGKIGFDFIGFTIKQFKTIPLLIDKAFFSPNKERLGFKTLIYPSKKSMNKHQKNLHQVILKNGKLLNQKALIKKLNPIIFRWATFFGISNANTTKHLQRQDYLTYLKLRKWANRITKSAKQGSKFWHKVKNRKWTFGCDDGNLIYHSHYSKPINKYIQVKDSSSPFDGEYLYWTNRLYNLPFLSLNTKIILKKQKGL